jgi:hypothetical protein
MSVLRQSVTVGDPEQADNKFLSVRGGEKIKLPLLGEGRDLPGRQIAGQDGKRIAGDDVADQHGHQPAPRRRPR